MRSLKRLLLVALIALPACAETGGQFNAEKLSAIPKNKSEVFIYKPSEAFLGAGIPMVKINDVKTCYIAPDTFFSRQIPSGITTISMGFVGTPGTSRIKFNAVSGKKYFIKVSSDKAKTASAVGFGLLGSAVSEITSKNAGPFIITIIDNEIGMEEIQNTKESLSCD